MKLSVSKNSWQRVQMSPSREATMQPHDLVEIAVNVALPEYVPDGVQLRARVSDRLFTAVTTADNLQSLEHDPGIKSVQIGQTLRLPETSD